MTVLGSRAPPSVKIYATSVSMTGMAVKNDYRFVKVFWVSAYQE